MRTLRRKLIRDLWRMRGQVATITLVAFTLTVVATIYPAIRGAATEPAEALRYE